MTYRVKGRQNDFICRRKAAMHHPQDARCANCQDRCRYDTGDHRNRVLFDLGAQQLDRVGVSTIGNITVGEQLLVHGFGE